MWAGASNLRSRLKGRSSESSRALRRGLFPHWLEHARTHFRRTVRPVPPIGNALEAPAELHENVPLAAGLRSNPATTWRHLTMSGKERKRSTVMAGVKAKELTLGQAAERMDLCRRQCPPVKRRGGASGWADREAQARREPSVLGDGVGRGGSIGTGSRRQGAVIAKPLIFCFPFTSSATYYARRSGPELMRLNVNQN